MSLRITILFSRRAPAARAGILAALLGLGAALQGCGQPGSLYLPTAPAAAHRATLPQSLWPGSPRREEPASAPAVPASAPAPTTSSPSAAP